MVPRHRRGGAEVAGLRADDPMLRFDDRERTRGDLALNGPEVVERVEHLELHFDVRFGGGQRLEAGPQGRVAVRPLYYSCRPVVSPSSERINASAIADPAEEFHAVYRTIIA